MLGIKRFLCSVKALSSPSSAINLPETPMRTLPPFTCNDEIIAIGEGLLARTVPKSDWTHAAHFASTLWLLTCRPEIDLSLAMPRFIRAYNESIGGQNTATSGYHETI